MAARCETPGRTRRATHVVTNGSQYCRKHALAACMATCSAAGCAERAPVVVDGAPLCRKHAAEAMAKREWWHAVLADAARMNEAPILTTL